MHAVLDRKRSPWQPAERLDPLKNGMKFRIAKFDLTFYHGSPYQRAVRAYF